MERLKEFRQAVKLLEDENLVWSCDFDMIRTDLARFLEQSIALGWDSNYTLQQIVKTLISEEGKNATE